MAKRISQLAAAASLTGDELVLVSRLSATVTRIATTLSALASDNSFNDSANGFLTAGFAVGKQVRVQGFTGNVANNIVSGTITALTAGKMTIGGTDGDVIVDDAAGESVTITQWDSVRTTAATLAGTAPHVFGWFNVKLYGATGDGSTDDTTAVQAAIDAAAAAGGGVVYFPAGVYVISGALQDTSRSNAQLLLPRIDVPDSEQITIELLGAFPPPADLSLIGAMVLPDGQSVIKGTLNTGSGTAPCLIGGWGPSGTSAELSNTHVILRNLTVRMPTNPVLTAIDLSRICCVELDNVIVDTGSYDVAGLSAPTTSTSYGIKLPKRGNGALTRLTVVNVVGFYKGIQVHEHTDADTVNVWGCLQALEFKQADHASHFRRLGVYHCPRGLVGTEGPHYVEIEQYNIEHAASGAWVSIYDVDDASNYLKGWLKWHVVLAGTGVDDTVTVNGAVCIRRERIGKWFVYALTDAATIAVPAGITDSFRVTLGGNRTLGNPTGLYDGQVLNIRVHQDGTGSRTLAYGSKWKFPGGAPTLSTAASAKDFISGQYDYTDDTIYASLMKAMS